MMETAGRGRWRLALWSGALILLTAPAVAMRFSHAMNWGLEDFAALAALLVSACVGLELAVRFGRSRRTRAALALLVLGVLALVWAHLAVGLV
jgi:peptidoglycan/LPS O-acetylase OafA/YrhL